MNIDPLAEKYLTLSTYTYVANTPIVAFDPDGKQIEIGLDYKRDDDGNIVRDADGNATITGININVTGKVINFSDNDVDMDDAISDMKDYFEKTFSGILTDGVKITSSFNFTEAKNMNEVNDDDHLIVLAEPGSNHIADGMTNRFGGKVSVVDADYFTGWWDTSYGTRGEQVVAHEIGHTLGLEHYKVASKNMHYLMVEGARGHVVSGKNYSSIIKNDREGKINLGSNYNSDGLPNFGRYTGANVFELTNTAGREKKSK